MKISKNVGETIKLFNKHIKKKPKNNITVQTNKIINNFYNDIKHSYKYVNLLLKKILLNTNVKQTKNIPYTDLLNSKYIPNNIKSIIKKGEGYIESSIKIYNTTIQLYILLQDTDFNNLNKYEIIIFNTIVWFKFALLYSKKNIKKVTVYLYLTNEKKYIPTDTTKIFGPDNCNTAITTACNPNGEILIYRKEEWFKVLIHETFHIFCLDFSGVSYSDIRTKFKQLVKINSDYEISETYSEFWANILNLLFYNYTLLDNKNDFVTYAKQFALYIRYEQMFSLFQCIKILNFLGLNYEMLYSNTKTNIQLKQMLYKENTNLYTYYILKVVLLIYYQDFFEWCDIYNTNILMFNKLKYNLNGFFLFIKKRYKSDKILNKIKNVEKIFTDIDNNKFLIHTMRMTLFNN